VLKTFANGFKADKTKFYHEQVYMHYPVYKDALYVCGHNVLNSLGDGVDDRRFTQASFDLNA